MASKGSRHGVRHGLAGLRFAFADPTVRSLPGLIPGLIAFGAVVYHWIEGWRLLAAACFLAITLATVGHGDFAPRTDAGKLFTIAFMLVGIGLFVALVSAVAERIITFRRTTP